MRLRGSPPPPPPPAPRPFHLTVPSMSWHVGRHVRGSTGEGLLRECFYWWESLGNAILCTMTGTLMPHKKQRSHSHMHLGVILWYSRFLLHFPSGSERCSLINLRWRQGAKCGLNTRAGRSNGLFAATITHALSLALTHTHMRAHEISHTCTIHFPLSSRAPLSFIGTLYFFVI
jgi:hypothetical protein